MLITTFDGICEFAFRVIENCRADGIDPASEAAKEWHKSNPESVYLRELMEVYNNAKANPPPGIIGVGAITYAEQALIDHQLQNPFNG